jgi:hypothetical protein
VTRRSRQRAGAPDEGAATDEIIVFVLGDDGEPDLGAPPPLPSLRERLGLVPSLPPVADIEQTRPRLTPGARLGQAVDEPRRSGFPEEILVTLHADPVTTAERALAGTALRSASRLRIDRSTLRVRRNDVLWRCTLRTGPLRRRPAMVRLYGSPSANVTVLTLSPERPRRVATRGFLRAGLRAMTELRDRLADEVAEAHPGR